MEIEYKGRILKPKLAIVGIDWKDEFEPGVMLFVFDYPEVSVEEVDSKKESLKETFSEDGYSFHVIANADMRYARSKRLCI